MRAVGGVHPSGNKTVFYRISQGWGEQKGILIYNPEFINGLLFGTRTKFQEQKKSPLQHLQRKINGNLNLLHLNLETI